MRKPEPCRVGQDGGHRGFGGRVRSLTVGCVGKVCLVKFFLSWREGLKHHRLMFLETK